MLGEESRHAWVKTFENSNLPKVICKRRSGDNILEIIIFVHIYVVKIFAH